MRLFFDGFVIDSDAYQLVRAGVVTPLEPRALDLLCYLAARPGQLVRKDELLENVWNARYLSDGVLSNAVAKLRRALGQRVKDAMPIETVHGRGYRWRAMPCEQRDTAYRANSVRLMSMHAPVSEMHEVLHVG